MKKSKRNENNFHPKLVLYKGKVYNTGNRYHNLIELYTDVFYKTVGMDEVEPYIRKADLRIVFRNGYYCITEVQYDKKGNVKKILDDECGVLSYWKTLKELKGSAKLVRDAFKQPIIYV